MRSSNLARIALTTLCLALIAGIVGCFESRYPLGPRLPGSVDLRYIGDWILETRNDQGETQTSRLIIRNLHNDDYYVEWITDGDKPLRMTGYPTDVNGVRFANLLPLTDDGKPADKFIIMRVDWDGDKLKLMNLRADFFKDRQFDSSEALRRIVAENLNNEEMYVGEPFVATREGR